jgi:hypothetical protein
MLDAYPADLGQIDKDALAACIDACFACAQTCTACADACLSEGMVAELAKCVRGNLDCADICETTGRVLSRHTGYDANLTQAVLQACATTCKSCGDECDRHANMHDHCRICAPKSAGAASRPATPCSTTCGSAEVHRGSADRDSNTQNWSPQQGGKVG